MSRTEVGSTGQQEGNASVAETVSEQATQVKKKGRAELREQLDQRTNDVGRQASSLAARFGEPEARRVRVRAAWVSSA